MTYGVISIYLNYIGYHLHLIFLQIMLSLLSTIHLSFFNLPLTSAIRSYNAENMSFRACYMIKYERI